MTGPDGYCGQCQSKCTYPLIQHDRVTGTETSTVKGGRSLTYVGQGESSVRASVRPSVRRISDCNKNGPESEGTIRRRLGGAEDYAKWLRDCQLMDADPGPDSKFLGDLHPGFVECREQAAVVSKLDREVDFA
jgi:hypothetical protein